MIGETRPGPRSSLFNWRPAAGGTVEKVIEAAPADDVDATKLVEALRAVALAAGATLAKAAERTTTPRRGRGGECVRLQKGRAGRRRRRQKAAGRARGGARGGFNDAAAREDAAKAAAAAAGARRDAALRARRGADERCDAAERRVAR